MGVRDVFVSVREGFLSYAVRLTDLSPDSYLKNDNILARPLFRRVRSLRVSLRL